MQWAHQRYIRSAMIDTLLICYVLIGRYHRYQNSKSHHALIDHYTHAHRGTQRARNAELEGLLQISLNNKKKKNDWTNSRVVGGFRRHDASCSELHIGCIVSEKLIAISLSILKGRYMDFVAWYVRILCQVMY